MSGRKDGRVWIAALHGQIKIAPLQKITPLAVTQSGALGQLLVASEDNLG